MSPSKAWLLSRLCLGLSVTLTCRCSSKQLPSSPRGLPCRSRNRHGRHGRPRSCRCCRRACLLPQPAAPQSRFCRTDCSPQPRFRLWVQGLRRRGQWVRAAAPRPLPPESAQAPARRRHCRWQQRRAALLWAPPARPARPRAAACAPAPAGTATPQSLGAAAPRRPHTRGKFGAGGGGSLFIRGQESVSVLAVLPSPLQSRLKHVRRGAVARLIQAAGARARHWPYSFSLPGRLVADYCCPACAVGAIRKVRPPLGRGIGLGLGSGVARLHLRVQVPHGAQPGRDDGREDGGDDGQRGRDAAQRQQQRLGDPGRAGLAHLPAPRPPLSARWWAANWCRVCKRRR